MTPTPAPTRRHGIVNVVHRGILGGYVNWCSCGASIVEPDGGHEATDAHLAGPPNPPRPRKTRHFTESELAAHDAQVAERVWDEGAKHGVYHASRGEAVIFAIDNPYRRKESTSHESPNYDGFMDVDVAVALIDAAVLTAWTRLQ